jgi:hypothetical protein
MNLEQVEEWRSVSEYLYLAPINAPLLYVRTAVSIEATADNAAPATKRRKMTKT